MSLLMYTVLSCRVFFLNMLRDSLWLSNSAEVQTPKILQKALLINIQLLLIFAPAIMYQNIKEITSVFSEFCRKSLHVNKYVI